jgi:hypothetical protein
VLCFQWRHLVAAALTEWESSFPKGKTVVYAQGIGCVFLCIFLLRQWEMRGYVLQLSSQLRPGHVKDLPSCACDQCAVSRVL